MSVYKFQIAELLLRSFAGILFVFQGYDKLVKIGIAGVTDVFARDAEQKHIPATLIKAVAWYTSVVEFAGGILLLLGAFTNYTLYALGLDILLVCFAFSYMNALWDMKYVFPRLILLAALLLLPEAYCYFSIDHLFGLK